MSNRFEFFGLSSSLLRIWILTVWMRFNSGKCRHELCDSYPNTRPSASVLIKEMDFKIKDRDFSTNLIRNAYPDQGDLAMRANQTGNNKDDNSLYINYFRLCLFI